MTLKMGSVHLTPSLHSALLLLLSFLLILVDLIY